MHWFYRTKKSFGNSFFDFSREIQIVFGFLQTSIFAVFFFLFCINLRLCSIYIYIVRCIFGHIKIFNCLSASSLNMIRLFFSLHLLRLCSKSILIFLHIFLCTDDAQISAKNILRWNAVLIATNRISLKKKVFAYCEIKVTHNYQDFS